MVDKSKRHYPVFLDLNARPVIVVGGGEAVARRVKQLLRYGADITVISLDPGDALRESAASGEINLETRSFASGDLAGAFAAVCVSEDEAERMAVRSEAEAQGCLLNVADAPEMCSFLVPAIVNREPLQIAVSTAGLAPGLTKQIRREIAEQYGPEWGAYTQLMGETRAIAMALIPDPEQRTAALEAVAEADVLERLRAGETVTAAELMRPYVPEQTEQAKEPDAEHAEQAEQPDAEQPEGDPQ